MRRTTMLGGAVALLVLLTCSTPVLASGVLIPKNESIPPLAVKYLRVNTTIENQAATTHVTQEFQNSTSRDLECTYIFPLPKGAAVRDFAMYINGKRMKGELLDKDKARRVYETIVRRMKDPALLEYMDGSLLRLRIYPVPAHGTQKIEVEYTELVSMDAGLAEYVFPLKTGRNSSRTLEDFTVSVRIKSNVPIKSVYSPSHDVGVSKVNEHEAVAGMETKKALLDEDFRLFYTVSKKDFGLNLMTYRPDPDKPGMFLLLVSPKNEVDKSERVPRDMVFVLDTSGSMSGEKLPQAKAALKQCINAMEPEDRFAVVQFSTIAQTYAKGWTKASKESRKQVCNWVDTFKAKGGTNIFSAMEKALSLPVDAERPTTVMFLTDGKPTVNITDINQLADMVKKQNSRSLRVFTFGVGNDVNTHLLDRFADDTGGLPEYVRPDEKIDTKVTRLFSKMTHPVLTGLKIDIPGVKIADMYPSNLPDLFAGSQVVIVGSYEKHGDSVIRLTGNMGAVRKKFVYEGTFAEKSVEKSFIGTIYAHRKIGFLLDAIRLHGENNELKNEVIRLSLLHGIETPYTSYLVLESKEQYAQYGLRLRQSVKGAAGGKMSEKDVAEANQRSAQVATRLAGEMKDAPATATPSLRRETSGMKHDYDVLKKAKSGAKAVDVAQDVQRMRQAENFARDMRGRNQVLNRANRQLTNYRGVWVDEKFQGTEKLTKVRWGSKAYFRLVRERADLREMLNVGQRVVVVTARNQALVVDVDDGLDKLDDKQMKNLFTDM